jgi:hypothetical protein
MYNSSNLLNIIEAVNVSKVVEEYENTFYA